MKIKQIRKLSNYKKGELVYIKPGSYPVECKNAYIKIDAVTPGIVINHQRFTYYESAFLTAAVKNSVIVVWDKDIEVCADKIIERS